MCSLYGRTILLCNQLAVAHAPARCLFIMLWLIQLFTDNNMRTCCLFTLYCSCSHSHTICGMCISVNGQTSSYANFKACKMRCLSMCQWTNLSNGEDTMLAYMRSVVQVFCDLFHMNQHKTNPLAPIPARGESMSVSLHSLTV